MSPRTCPDRPRQVHLARRAGYHPRVRVARVLTNETCNQACRFCDARRPAEQPAFVRPAAVLARIDAALATGARELVLTGGEPTMRRDLAALVRHARARGAARVVLETNAALIGEPLARALADAGLTLARVHLPAPGDLADAITRDPGGAAATLAGLRALASAAVPLEVAIPLVRATLDHAHDIPAWLRAHAIPIEALVAVVPTDAPEPDALADLHAAAAALARLDLAARATALPLRLDPGAAIPPCTLEHPGPLAHLYALTPGGAASPRHRRVAACDRCSVADRCPGVPAAALARAPDLALRPITDDRTRRRLTVIESTAAQIDRELVTRDVHRDDHGRAVPSHIVRIQFHCNQACTFCFVSTHLPAPDDAAIRRAILEVAHLRGALQLSGGEPTLHPHLVDYVALGKREGAATIELQTNAIRLADGDLAQRLADAGLDVAFVSLHAATAATSDALTRAPGTYEKTLRGVDALAAAGVLVRLNFVFCAANSREFPDLVRRVIARWPRAELNVSVATAFTDLVPRTAALVPRYSDILPAMTEGLGLARAAGLVVHGFESMCGMPLCLAPGDPARHLALAAIEGGFDQGEFVRADACARCDLATRCFGVRRSYAALHGTDELRPVTLTAP